MQKQLSAVAENGIIIVVSVVILCWFKMSGSFQLSFDVLI